MASTPPRENPPWRGYLDVDSSRLHGFALIAGDLFCFLFAHDQKKLEPEFSKRVGCNLETTQVGHQDDSAVPFSCRRCKLFFPLCGVVTPFSLSISIRSTKVAA